MPGLFSRLKTWIQDEKLLYSDLNAEFNNIINNAEAQKIKGHSDTINQMRLTEDPGSVGSESTGTSISAADEIERLRYAINRIIGGTYWYETPNNSLNSISNTLNSTYRSTRIISGRIDANNQPMFLVPNTSSNGAKVKGSSTNFVYSIGGTIYTINTDVSISSLTLAPVAGGTCVLTNDRNMFESEINLSSSSSEFSAIIGKYSLFKVGAGGSTEYVFGFMESSSKITKCFSGYLFNGSDVNQVSYNNSAGASVAVLGTNWIFAKTDLTLDYCSTNPTFSPAAPGSPAVGDYWFDVSTNKWKRYAAGTWNDANAVLVGVVGTDSTNAIIARSFDFDKTFSSQNSLSFYIFSANVLKTAGEGYSCSVYGNSISSQVGNLTLTFASDCVDGATSTDLNYWIYLKDTGSLVASNYPPLNRTHDLLGKYHPSKPWRFVGTAHRESPISNIYWVHDEKTASNGVLSSITSSSAAYVDAPFNLKFVSSGKPIEIGFYTDGTSGPFELSTGYVDIRLTRHTSEGISSVIGVEQFLGTSSTQIPASSVKFYDRNPPSGYFWYTVEINPNSNTMTVYPMYLLAKEVS